MVYEKSDLCLCLIMRTNKIALAVVIGTFIMNALLDGLFHASLAPWLKTVLLLGPATCVFIVSLLINWKKDASFRVYTVDMLLICVALFVLIIPMDIFLPGGSVGWRFGLLAAGWVALIAFLTVKIGNRLEKSLARRWCIIK